MKDCTRLDVVSANLRKRPNENSSKPKSVSNEYWYKLKKEMNNKNWKVSNNTLKCSEEIGGCTLDVSIEYSRNLRKYIQNINFNHTSSEEKSPVDLKECIVSELNSLSLLANKLSEKLSEESVNGNNDSNSIN
tara:strand:+ start:1968 stop:2366 length:399 start_codon:yes stop_codon:yes gene_type:complete